MTNSTQDQTTDRGTMTRSLLWVLLVISLVCNATTSAIGLSVFISGAFGLLTLGSGVALVLHHRRQR
ncbi:hypothetical protein [Amycolatopsis pithecellobii]|uniref:Uncharacterized protein n=1 Tax=Amycolatopsis pithecellobii TaxID=664692 RepID=A0A6N7ZA57_9PSEU|nr:hypothetical protein [Amycolatopsis pithecellobii]MTD58626.1 hypothetical protein [Amycolatopsis pithecellobii]